MFFVSCVSHAFVSVHCCLVVTCWEMADLLALVGDVYCTFPSVILGQVCYLVLSFPEPRRLSYLHIFAQVRQKYFIIWKPLICTMGHPRVNRKNHKYTKCSVISAHISLASFLWDIDKHQIPHNAVSDQDIHCLLTESSTEIWKT